MNFATQSIVKKTRKNHHCTWCDEVIAKGSSCVSRGYDHEGEVIRDWSHFECYAAMVISGVREWMAGQFIRGSIKEKE
tara:strand:+ start:5147 stop:5380 length:234 start_codon:yes stop_codon:yes gene_type:complete